MAGLIRPFIRSLLSLPNSLLPLLQQLNQIPISIPNQMEFNLFLFHTRLTLTRNYISEMSKSAFQDNILRLLRNEILYELDRAPLNQSVVEFNSFTIDDRPGEQWIRLKRKFAENEDIKLEATMFDGAIPSPKAGAATEDNQQLHITLIVNISKGDGDSLEIMCSAWPDTIEITKLFVHKSDKMPAQAYVGPDFKELDDELQDSLNEFLEARGIDDQMASFLHECMKNKDRTEYVRWMGAVKSYIEEK